ncbi:unnamed protein product [Phytophthora lilii]|uniref:Unnamed protein product n=1 Tax=Phytophthora lilii TaxID=2077276 RepID=A0A9W6TIX8_9STRA|nr:unnamed protein product [Phytophthora lilii]
MQPDITNPIAGATVSDGIKRFRSPFSTVPATTSPFAAVKKLQVTVGNVPIWNNSVSFGHDLFVQEMSKSGVDGGLDDVTSAGLLSQRQRESLYRFFVVAVDIGRRLPSEDGSLQSLMRLVSQGPVQNYETNVVLINHILIIRDLIKINHEWLFSDNQTKQKAFDRYYNAMAKSDFVQGKMPKSLIQRESLDDASTDSLANLFQQVMRKNREYEYDQITKKLLKGPKGPPEIIKGEANETPKTSKKKHTYVPQSTDADANMEEPTAPEQSFDDFFSGVNDVAHKFRREDSNRRRQEMAAKFADEVMKESVKLLKRMRTETPPNKSPTDKRATKRAAKQDEDISRKLFQQSDEEEESDNEETKQEIKEEKRLRKYNAGIKKVYTDDINSYKSQFAANLYESIRHRFAEAVEQRKGKDYFEDNAPKPPRKHKMKRDAMNQYKAELKG